MESEAYFESLLCKSCQRNYYSNQETKLCGKCTRKERHNIRVAELDGIMQKKQNEIRTSFPMPGKA